MLKLTKRDINKIGSRFFIDNYFMELQGAAIFVSNKKSKVSNIVSFFCKKDSADGFVPSHIASCYKETNGQLYLLDIKPPKSSKQKLDDYLKNTNDDYIIVLRQEQINLDKYNKYMQERVGLWYGLISAVQTIFKHIAFKHGMHCSENYIYAYNQQNFYWDINANKSTPANLLKYLLNKYKNRKIKAFKEGLNNV